LTLKRSGKAWNGIIWINQQKTKDNAISYENYGNRLLGRRGVHFD
jgi:hypothetical protein